MRRQEGGPLGHESARGSDAWIETLAKQVTEATRGASTVWCIFDNTASGAALPNALELLERLPSPDGRDG